LPVKLLCLSIALLLNGCVIQGPYTGTRYEIGANAEVGLFISAKPLGFDAVSETASKTYDWLTEDEKECTVKD